MAALDERMLRLITGEGYKLTSSRRAILQAVTDREDHFRAEEILEAAKRIAPRTGRATVYRTLELLDGLGLVEQVHLGGGSHEYVRGDVGHHHHFICSGCGKVTEFWGCQVAELVDAFASRYGFQVESHQLEIYGRCLDCKDS